MVSTVAIPASKAAYPMFHVEQSIDTERTAMWTLGTIHQNRALDA